MSAAWGNTDSANSKPLFPKERETRNFIYLTTANSTVAGVRSIQFAGTGALTAANLGITVGMVASTPNTVVGGANAPASNSATATALSVINAPLPGQILPTAGLTRPGFQRANNVVTAVTGNLVTFANATMLFIPPGAAVAFDTIIPYASNEEANTYNRDVILVTPSRLVNANVTIANTHAGWSHVYRTVNSDGTVRYRKEVLVALANSTATNASSANTSQFGIYRGV